VFEDLGPDAQVDEKRVMCLDADVFNDLCNLYPQTKETLKILGLKKRRLFMECLKLQEDEAAMGKSKLSCIVYKGHMKAHSKFLDKLTGLVEAEHDDRDLNMSGNNRTALSSQILNPDEQDMDEPDEKIEQQL